MRSSRITTLLVYVLVTLFGVSTWLNLQGVFLEFPLIVPEAVEGWRLPATMGLIANSGSVALFFIAIIRWCSRGKIAYEIPVNIVVFSIGTGALFALAFVWNKTSIIAGFPRSTYLMALSFCLALVDVISSATFMPFLNRYQPRFLNGFLFGEALSSLVPGLLGLAQGVGQETCQNGTSIYHPARFSVQTYLIGLSAIMICSFLAFIILCSTNIGRDKVNDTRKSSITSELSLVLSVNDMYESDVHSNTPAKQMTYKQFWFSVHGSYLIMILLASLFNIDVVFHYCLIDAIFVSIFEISRAAPSLQTFSLYPYSIDVYHKTIIACQFAGPLMVVLAIFLNRIPTIVLYILTVIGTTLFAYIFITAKLSPCSPLVDKTSGRVLIALAWVTMYCVFHFIRITIANYIKRISAHRGLYWFGILTQTGSLLGALTVYLLTSQFNIFRERHLCQSYVC